jgi:hypothetical protein
MSWNLLDAKQSATGMTVTFVTEYGIELLEGSCEEFGRLAEVMQQVSVLVELDEHEAVWIEDVAVGDAIVKLGLNPGKQARIQILRP